MRLDARVERWPLREAFTIARGAKREAVVVSVRVSDGTHVGRGEAVPYARYGEDPDGVLAQVRALAGDELDRATLRERLPPGAARNALDLALWDLEAEQAGTSVAALAGLSPRPVVTAVTLPIRDLAETRALARRHAGQALLKVKVGADMDDLARLEVVREEAPSARLIVDANEGWSETTLERAAERLAALGVELLEQPLPAGRDAALAGWSGPVLLCADESFHGEPAELDALVARYRAVNVKLDKQGGLTAALDAVARAEALGLEVMVGTMVASSLAVAPAVLLATRARWADVDAAMFLAHDRDPPIRYDGATRAHPPSPALWG